MGATRLLRETARVYAEGASRSTSMRKHWHNSVRPLVGRPHIHVVGRTRNFARRTTEGGELAWPAGTRENRRTFRNFLRAAVSKMKPNPCDEDASATCQTRVETYSKNGCDSKNDNPVRFQSKDGRRRGCVRRRCEL